jgi:hypothetical protein
MSRIFEVQRRGIGKRIWRTKEPCCDGQNGVERGKGKASLLQGRPRKHRMMPKRKKKL